MEKRLSLHRSVEVQKHQNEALKSQLADLQHLANIGTVSHMIAHEMNNLLTPLKSYASFALENLDDSALTEKALRKTVKNSGRAAKVMESMLALVSGEKQEMQLTCLLDMINEIFTCLCRDFSKDRINVEINVPDNLTIYVVPVQVQQVFMNLILNARDAMLQQGGTLTIGAIETEDIVEIEIADTGSGIEPDDLKNIFETFFTTKSDNDSPAENSGAGIGLAFCKMIIDRHQGSISVKSKPGHGTMFKIILPKTTVG